MKDYYICRFHLNASHSYDGDIKKAHSHTFRVEIYTGKSDSNDINADVSLVDREVNDFLEAYTGRFLNAMPAFAGRSASLEDIGELFFTMLTKRFIHLPFDLYELRISDNPLSAYSVSDRVLLPIVNMENSTANYDRIIEQKSLLHG